MALTAAELPLPSGVTVSDVQAAAALGIVESYCQWPLAQASNTVTLDSEGGEFVRLPAMAVSAVASVVLNGDNNGQAFPTLVVGRASAVGVDVTWRESGLLRWVRDNCGWPCGDGRVTVTFTAGYESLPPGVLAVVASVAERIDVTAAVQQQLENVGGIQTNQTFTNAANAGNGLTSVEMAVLDNYRIGNLR